MYALKDILNEPDLLRGFQDFCQIQHASENLTFWLAVESFRSCFNSSQEQQQQREGSSSAVSIAPAQTTKRSTLTTQFKHFMISSPMRQRLGSKFRLSYANSNAVVTSQQMAQRIFDEFLQPSSPSWVCHDHQVSDRIKQQLEQGEQAEPSWFDAIQGKVFTEMEKDLVIRFNQSFQNELVATKSGSAEKEEEDNAREGLAQDWGEGTVFTISPSAASASSRGSSMRFYPDNKLRASMSRSIAISKSPSQLTISNVARSSPNSPVIAPQASSISAQLTLDEDAAAAALPLEKE